MKRRDQQRHPRARLGGGTRERVGVDPLVVHRHTHQRDPQALRDRLEAEEGGRFAEHRVAGRRDRLQRERHALGRAGAEHEVASLDAREASGARKPRRRRLAVALRAIRRRVVEQVERGVVVRELRQQFEEPRFHGANRRQVVGEIDRAVALGRAGRSRRGDECALAHARAQQAAPLRLGVGAGHRAEADRELLRQVALRREPGADGERAFRDVTLERRDQACVEGLGAGLDGRSPLPRGFHNCTMTILILTQDKHRDKI